MPVIIKTLLTVSAILLVFAQTGRSQNADEDDAMSGTGSLLNMPFPTTGGMQFWTDHRWSYGWRIQHNLMTNHWRLIDSGNIRRAWGSRQACEKELARQLDTSKLTAPEEIVVLVHGLMRTSGSMASLAKELNRDSEWQAVPFGYASTRASIADHSAALREWVEALPGTPRLSFVGHSLGNIVTRHAIGDWERDDPKNILGRLNRVVMLGPPNNGSSLATKLSRIGLFEMLTGTAGMELGPRWELIQSRLAIPPCPFAIIAGDMSESSLRNPFVTADGDLVVTLEETKLPGAEFISLPVLHSFLPTDEKAILATRRFLEAKSKVE